MTASPTHDASNQGLLNTMRTQLNTRRRLLTLAILLLLAAPASAQPWLPWPHCGGFGPHVFEDVYLPGPSILPYTNDPIPVQQSTVYLLGYALNWRTGQQPKFIDVSFVNAAGQEQPAQMMHQPLLPAQNVADWYNAKLPAFGWHGDTVSSFIGYAAYFATLPPLDTKFFRIRYYDLGCQPTFRQIHVQVNP